LRLGAELPVANADADTWASAHAGYGFSAAILPVSAPALDTEVDAYVRAARAFNIQIAEVGAWSNPLASDEAESKAAIQHCQEQLALAERAGARCCVNIAGSVGPTWAGPFGQDLHEDTFALVVETVRAIIDGVRPTRTFYALEAMPWMFPDSIDAYERLLGAIERPAFGVHFDPVNLVSSPRLYFDNGAMIKEFVRRLGPHIRSCHAKDVSMSEQLTVHLDEVRPGTGALDYRALVRSVEDVDTQLSLIIEHLPSTDECLLAAGYIRSVCQEESVDVIAPEVTPSWDAP
jgi:sugar phosphate isomerase/epimerase